MTDLIRIMLVEDDADICDSYKLALNNNSKMRLCYVTDSERDALCHLESHEMDVIILDLELREGDGISFLEELKLARQSKPFVVVVTNTISKIILNLVRQNGADYIYQKTNLSYSPYKVLSIIEKAFPYKQMTDTQNEMLLVEKYTQEKYDRLTRKYIMDYLQNMGFRTSMIGTKCLQEILFLIVSGEKRLEDTSLGELYAAAGKVYNNSDINVEKAIRVAIEGTWRMTKLSVLERYYPFGYNKEKGKPTNRDFIYNLSYKLRSE
ncbi:MAG: sporulation initiation factor Spo0A C-terminal domain-containing protein [bacterium]|nr:sporulation initiation factor Spo0A C-terminal domain-containing protein [bacterium]